MGSDTKNSPRKNKIKKIERYVRDSAEVILTDFWDIPSVVYFKLVAESAAIIWYRYFHTPRKRKARIQRVGSYRISALLERQCSTTQQRNDNWRDSGSWCRWCQSSFIPHLAPSEIHQFPKPKGQREFSSDSGDAVQTEEKLWFHRQSEKLSSYQETRILSGEMSPSPGRYWKIIMRVSRIKL